MAKVFGVGSQLSGKVGQLIYAQTKKGTVVYEAPVKAKVPRRSEKQMEIRTQWVNLAAVYRQFNQTLKKAYEDAVGSGMSVYNAFVQANVGVCKVYITKKVRLNGGSVLAPYQISRGTLDGIDWQKNSDGVLVTDIALGGLNIGDETSIAEFSQAVIAYNDDYEEGDQITFFYGRQTEDPVTGVPRAKITGFKIILDTKDDTPLWLVVSALGFSSVSGGQSSGFMLGMGEVIASGAAAWIHSRENSDGTLKLSTQYLTVDSAVLAQYQGDTAFGTSADSYGGINTRAVYLQPVAANVVRPGVTVDTELGTTDSGGGSGSTDSGGTSTGSDTGGGTDNPPAGGDGDGD